MPQVVFVVLVVSSIPGGWVMVRVWVTSQLFRSLMVTVYVPAVRFTAVADVCTGFVLHEYVYGAVPPAAEALAEPLLPPKQVTFWLTLAVADRGTAGSVMVTVVLARQLSLSATVTV